MNERSDAEPGKISTVDRPRLRRFVIAAIAITFLFTLFVLGALLVITVLFQTEELSDFYDYSSVLGPVAAFFTFIIVFFTFILCSTIDLLLPATRRAIRSLLSILIQGAMIAVLNFLATAVELFEAPYLGLVLPSFFVSLISTLVYFKYVAIETSESRRAGQKGLGKSRSFVEDDWRTSFQKQLKKSPLEVSTEVLEFHRRANSLMQRANVVLWIIVAVLLFTAVFIVFAGKISELGTAKISPLSDMTADRDGLQDGLQILQGEVEDLENELAREKRKEKESNLKLREIDGLSAEERGALLVESETARGEIIRIESLKKLKSDHIRIERERLNHFDAEVRNAREELLLPNANVGAEDAPGTLGSLVDPRLLLATGITRFGVLIIAIYLVQILINLYRYNTRAAAYYLAHADSLLLAELDPEVTKLRHASLFPDFGYGRMPRSPLHGVSGLGAAFDRAKEGFRRRNHDPSA